MTRRQILTDPAPGVVASLSDPGFTAERATVEGLNDIYLAAVVAVIGRWARVRRVEAVRRLDSIMMIVLQRSGCMYEGRVGLGAQ